MPEVGLTQMRNDMAKKNIGQIIIKVIIAALSALAGAIGGSAIMSLMFTAIL